MTPMSPLQLKRHCFTTIVLKAVERGSADAPALLSPDIRFERNPEAANQWRLSLSLKVRSGDDKKPFAYEAEVKVQGLVEVSDKFPEEKREQLAAINGFSILFSAAREMLLNLTARSLHGPLTLPTLNFTALVDSHRKRAQQAPVPPKTTQPASAQ